MNYQELFEKELVKEMLKEKRLVVYAGDVILPPEFKFNFDLEPYIFKRGPFELLDVYTLPELNKQISKQISEEFKEFLLDTPEGREALEMFFEMHDGWKKVLNLAQKYGFMVQEQKTTRSLKKGGKISTTVYTVYDGSELLAKLEQPDYLFFITFMEEVSENEAV